MMNLCDCGVFPGDSPLCSPSTVEVNDKKANVLSDGRGSSSPNPSSEFQTETQTLFYITNAKQQGAGLHKLKGMQFVGQIMHSRQVVPLEILTESDGGLTRDTRFNKKTPVKTDLVKFITLGKCVSNSSGKILIYTSVFLLLREQSPV